MLRACVTHHERMVRDGFALEAWNPSHHDETVEPGVDPVCCIVMVSNSSINAEEQATLLQNYVSPAILKSVLVHAEESKASYEDNSIALQRAVEMSTSVCEAATCAKQYEIMKAMMARYTRAQIADASAISIIPEESPDEPQLDVAFVSKGTLRCVSFQQNAPQIWTKEQEADGAKNWQRSPLYFVVHAYNSKATRILHRHAGALNSLVCGLRAATVAKMMGVPFTLSYESEGLA